MNNMSSFDVHQLRRDTECLTSKLKGVANIVETWDTLLGLANTVGGSTQILGGVAAITGAVLGPATGGLSLVLTELGTAAVIAGFIVDKSVWAANKIGVAIELNDAIKAIRRFNDTWRSKFVELANEIDRIIKHLEEEKPEYFDKIKLGGIGLALLGSFCKAFKDTKSFKETLSFFKNFCTRMKVLIEEILGINEAIVGFVGIISGLIDLFNGIKSLKNGSDTARQIRKSASEIHDRVQDFIVKIERIRA